MSDPRGRMAEIGERIRTQDNRITNAPIFVVQQKRRIWGMDSGYADDFAWVYTDGDGKVDEEQSAQLERMYRSGDDTPGEVARVGYTDTWEFVTACFTEQGCKDYLALNGHNLHEPRIYAEGSYRNREWNDVRQFLLSLAAQEVPA